MHTMALSPVSERLHMDQLARFRDGYPETHLCGFETTLHRLTCFVRLCTPLSTAGLHSCPGAQLLFPKARHPVHRRAFCDAFPAFYLCLPILTCLLDKVVSDRTVSTSSALLLSPLADQACAPCLSSLPPSLLYRRVPGHLAFAVVSYLFEWRPFAAGRLVPCHFCCLVCPPSPPIRGFCSPLLSCALCATRGALQRLRRSSCSSFTRPRSHDRARFRFDAFFFFSPPNPCCNLLHCLVESPRPPPLPPRTGPHILLPRRLRCFRSAPPSPFVVFEPLFAAPSPLPRYVSLASLARLPPALRV